MKINKPLLSSMAIALVGGFASQNAAALAAYCSDVSPTTTNGTLYTSDVTFTSRNGSLIPDRTANDCYGPFDPINPGGNVSVAEINTLKWNNPSITGDEFVYLDKTGQASVALEGLTFTLEAVLGKTGTFTLEVADGSPALPNLPTFMDLVFGLKSSSTGTALYFFDDILIGNTNGGEYTISFKNASDKEIGALSNAVVWGRLGTGGTPGSSVPEPGIAALLGIGLLGQALFLRQRRRQKQ